VIAAGAAETSPGNACKEFIMAGHRILIVEDSPTMRQLLVFALKRMKDVDITEAQDGMDGLRKVTSDHFDLAFVDINMPVMDGLKLISLIRGEQNLAGMPICVITTEGAKEDRERAIALGANEYLTKPIQANKVLAVAKSLLKLDT
jgi:two-component system chemotaxis response regulator CheY